MYKKFVAGLLILSASFFIANVYAQTDSIKKLPTYHIGIFAPLYLDSVFNNGSFKYKDAMPKFITPSLEFIQGAQVALDSMPSNGNNIEAFIYDSKSYSNTLPNLISSKNLDSLDLIIGSVKDADYKQLANFAVAKKIPFISATYPNDGGIVANPYTVILNSTLKAHCEAIYSYLLQSHGTDPIFLYRKKGTQEDKITNYFKMLNEQDGKPLLKMQTINADSILTAGFLQPQLDSNRHTVIIGGSLDESFASALTTASYNLSGSYNITLIGMPNWDGFNSLKKKTDFDGFPIYFTSPYFNYKWDNYSKMLASAYLKKFKAKPSDMAYKGFEVVYLFTQLLTKYPKDFMAHINDKNFKVICDYNIRPVLLKKENTKPDYYENKHLYFIKMLNGVISKAW